jgi:hypothetical protein
LEKIVTAEKYAQQIESSRQIMTGLFIELGTEKKSVILMEELLDNKQEKCTSQGMGGYEKRRFSKAANKTEIRFLKRSEQIEIGLVWLAFGGE